MIIADLQERAKEFVSENATTILTAGGVVGTVATAVLAGRAGYKYAELIALENDHRRRSNQQQVELQGDNAIQKEPVGRKEKILLVGPQFIPPVLTGAATIAAIIGANRMSAQKAAALAAAYGLSQKQFEEYKAKVAEKLTGPKTQQVQDELAQDRVNKTPGAGQLVIVEGGDVLCFDQPTGRYFKSSMEKINRAVNKTNEEIIHHDHVGANFFYEELGLAPTTWGDEVGWNSNQLLELDISAVVSPEDERTPCLAIDFRHLPTQDYMRRMY